MPSIPDTETIGDLTDAAAKRHLAALFASLSRRMGDLPPGMAIEMLESLCITLDEGDAEDVFGTEGWRRFFT